METMSTVVITPGPVTTVTLNRPDVRNAFNEDLIAELTAWAQSVPDDGSIRAVVLQGAGSVFCAGADVQWMAKMIGYTREENLQDARRAAMMLHALDSLPVPVIGRVHGAALGGGAGLAAVCDVVVAADDAVFGFTEVVLGILPAMISPYVVRKIGLSAAREWCLNGARFSAARAKEIGLVHDVVTADRLDLTVERHVHQFAKAAPSAIAATKRLLRDVAGHRPGDVMALTVDAIATQRVSPEGQEGLRAFLEKRPPKWAAERPAAPARPGKRSASD
jgi:methylglutaconyl-CoA hydratase